MVLVFTIYRKKREHKKNRKKKEDSRKGKQTNKPNQTSKKPKHPSFLTFCPRQIKPLLCSSQPHLGDRPPCLYLALDKSGSPLTLAGLQVLTRLIWQTKFAAESPYPSADCDSNWLKWIKSLFKAKIFILLPKDTKYILLQGKRVIFNIHVSPYLHSNISLQLILKFLSG